MAFGINLEGKRIVVTGSHGLIGRSCVELALKGGAEVLGLDQGLSEVDESCQFSSLDCTDMKEMEKFILKVQDEKALDGWVNCAYPRTSDWGDHIENLKDESFIQNVQLQMNSLCLLTRMVGLAMKKNQKGSIVNLSSIYGSLAPDFSIYEGTGMTMPAPYSAIKGGIESFSRYMASYLGPDGVRVNCISAGGVFNHQPESFVKSYAAKTMLKRMARSEEIAASVIFLLSDGASYVTGQNWLVDGGWSSM